VTPKTRGNWQHCFFQLEIAATAANIRDLLNAVSELTKFLATSRVTHYLIAGKAICI